VHGPASHHRYEAILAAVAGLDGRRDEALARFATAIDGFRDAGLELELVLIAVDMALVLGADDPAVVSLLPETRSRIERLGITPIGVLLETLLAAGAMPTARTDSEPGTSGNRLTKRAAELRR
jgi:hypothetical protein